MFNPLNEKELSFLQDFLNAGHDDANPMNITEIHGFFCALLSAPNLIMPSQWQPMVFGGEPEFKSLEEAQEIINLLMRLNNQVSSQLREGKDIQLILWEDNKLVSLDHCSEITLAQWCEGYIEAVGLDPTWDANEHGIALLFPFAVLANQMELKGEKDIHGNIIEDDAEYRLKFKNKLPEYVKEIYDYWLERRVDTTPIYKKASPERRSFDKIGRNETCPCGSGKKYKKCCYEAITFH